MSEDKKRRWSWKTRLAYGAVTIVIILAVGECGLRILQKMHGPEVYQIGDDGCSTISFLAIGDSMTYGLGAERDEAYPIQFKHFFDKTHLGISAKIHNIGWAGTNTSHGLVRVREFLKHNPEEIDFAFILYGVNNRWNLNRATFWDWDKSAKSDHLAAYVASDLQLNKAFSLMLQSGHTAAAKMRGDYRAIQKDKGWSVFFDGFDDDLLMRWIAHDFKEIVSLLKSKDIQPVFLTYFAPRFEYLNPFIIHAAEEIGVPAIDLEKPTRFYRRRRMFDSDNFHLNANGYRNVARRLNRAFSKQFDKQKLKPILDAKKKDCSGG
ncbi:MAG: SGNH/GDSL hydrolase family protein [Deltaproteobacteria bacterium]|nr:SGNH/GDSL hydrolase family protein [Deltaproteobacteria bacterium]